MITRRGALGGGLAALSLALRSGRAEAGPFEDILAQIEGRVGGRLGVALLDTASGELTGRRLDERFPLCSTFKVWRPPPCWHGSMAAGEPGATDRVRARGPGAVLAGHGAADRRERHEPRRTVRGGGDPQRQHRGQPLLQALGGPPGLTAHLRSLGDRVTRLDRTEPTLNEAAPDDPRDTTSPAAMVRVLAGLTLGSALSQPSRDRLNGWLRDNRTGGARLRAGLPPGWRIGEKTGTGERGTTNDVGVLWPPDGAAQVVAVYLTGSDRPLAEREAALAAVAKAVVEA